MVNDPELAPTLADRELIDHVMRITYRRMLMELAEEEGWELA
jgi:hypothetical protein